MNGKEKALEIWKKAVSIFNTDKKIKWIVLIGMIGILLILLSEILPQNTKTPQDAVSVSIDNETFCRQTEAKIHNLVSSIQGVGEAQVWVTLESGAEYVYLQEEIRNTDTTKDYDSEGVKTLREKDNSEQKYILVNKNGEEQPLLQKQLEPTVQGVVIVCEGAGSAQVNEQVVNAVTCALGISSNRVYVAQLTKPSK
ncbi:MAG TPA: hypothetical protein DCL14_04555 [Ruminococcaceae bacterium]|nr:hypothetical protein [Oscillospiraceae bacterium]